MLSKSKGQILRISAALHVLFQLKIDDGDKEVTNGDEEERNGGNHHEATDVDQSSNTISDEALRAAIDFVETSTQHAAYIAGKDTIANELEKAGVWYYSMVEYS